MKRVAIAGGGIAGLAAAYELAQLARRGEPVQAVLFESSQRLGGIVETVREAGFVIEGGPDGWVSEKPWARQLAEELNLSSELIHSNDTTRKTYVLRDGDLKAMPDGMRMMVPSDLTALDTSDLFSPRARQYFRDEPSRAAELRASAPMHDESVAEFVRRHFGNEVLETIGAPLLSGVFGGDVATLSVRAVMAPFVTMEREYGSLVTALQARAGNSTPALFTTLRSGLGTLIDRIVASIPQQWIHLNTEVSAVARTVEGWHLTTNRGDESFDALFMAAPVHIAQSLLSPIDARAAELMQMDASSAVVVGFAFADATHSLKLPPGFGFLVPQGSGSLLLACTFMDQKFPDRVPEGGRLLRAFFGGESALRLMRCRNDEIAAIARLELARILGPLPEPQVTVIRHLPRSLPQYAVGHLERMAELNERVRALGSLWLLGNAYRGVGLPDLIRDARAAAQSLVACAVS
ncbi:protoporphyrinogen oxidase [Edaphobacter bradus]|uniref:protoporphyrinogen oxidase n=1 Tax=Edaphobacter bradus TaxID=2259016 RepID=UPI0021DF63E2|nr:protoporphyrinogen oxidase [Edaphobacter bradus]